MENKKDDGPGCFVNLFIIAAIVVAARWWYPKIESKLENNAGQKCMEKHDYQGAVTHYSKAINDDADNADAYYNRGTAYKSEGLTLSAQADFDSAGIIRDKKESKEKEDEQIKENARNLDDRIKGKIKDTGKRLLENWR